MGGGGCRRNIQQEPEHLRLEPSPCVLTLRSVIKDTNQSETPEASPTPLRLLAQPPSLPPSLSFPPLGSSLPSPNTLSFRSSSSSLLVTSPPTKGPLLLAHATPLCQTQLTEINLCGKQREGRREREGWEEEERAWRQPVIRTNVDGLRIAG